MSGSIARPEQVGQAEVRLDGLFLDAAVLFGEVVALLDARCRSFDGSAEPALSAQHLSQIHGCGWYVLSIGSDQARLEPLVQTHMM